MVAPDSTVTSGPKTTFGPITTSRPITVSSANQTRGRVGERRAVRHRLGAGAGLEGGLGGGEVGAGVDAERLGLGAGDDGGGEAARAGERHDVGQVVFALGVVVADPAEEVEERARRRRRSGRSCRGGSPLRRGVASRGLDDRREAAGGVEHQPAVAAGVARPRSRAPRPRRRRRGRRASPGASRGGRTACRRRARSTSPSKPASSGAACSTAWPVPSCSAWSTTRSVGVDARGRRRRPPRRRGR